MTISLRLSEEDSNLIKQYAVLKKQTVSEMIRQTVIEKIEEEYDLQIYEQAMKEYEESGITYTHDEVGKMLGIK